MKKGELVFYIFSVCVAAAAALYAFTFPSEAAYFPQIISVCIIAFCAVLIVRLFVKRKADVAPAKSEPQQEKKEEKKELTPTGKVLILCVMLFLYWVAFSYLGYIIPTILLVGGIIYLLGNRKWGTIVITSVLTSVILYVVFRFLLQVRFPTDTLFF